MAATASASAALAQSAVDPDLEDSNVSSPLTEVDDKDDNGEDIDHMQIDAEDGDNSSLSGDEQPADDNDRSESASVLSDAGSDDGNSDANDTEAETERLYDTPRNQRQRDVVIDQYNQGQVFEHTPSRLRRGAKPDDKDGDDEENSDRESVSGDEGSGASSAGDADDTPTKPSNSSKKLHDKAPSSDPHDRKRKRSPVADQSDTDQPQKKRTGSVGAASMDDGALNEDEKVAGNIESAVLSDADDEEASSNNRDTGTEGEALEQASRSSRSSRKSMRNGLRSKDSNREEEDDTGADAATETAGEEATDHQEDDVEADAEEETDAAAKNLEEMERKQAAFKDWSQIEEMFGIFRDRLYKDRLQRLEEEEQSLLADVPTHREYLNMRQCLDDRLNQKLQEVNTEFDFQLKANERWAVAQRAQIWSQFFQAVREKREHTLESLNKQWYDVQSSRRNAHSLQDYGLLFPKDPIQRLRNAIAYNSEVSTLSGMAKYEGFPAGPEMKGASATELKSDLSAMEGARRGRQKSSVFQQRDDYQSPNINQIGPAGEQFLKDTPWANPNHSAHKLARQGSAQEENRSIPQGPIFQSEPASSLKSPALSARLSESPEISRSILKPSAHQMKRVASVPTANRGAKATAV